MSGGFALPLDQLAAPDVTCAAYERWVSTGHLAPASARSYASKARAFLRWVDEHPVHQLGEVLTSGHERDFAVRDYREHLTAVGAPSSVDVSLAAIDNLFEWVGVGRAARVGRVSPKRRTAPQSLTAEQTKAVLRAAEKRQHGSRDLAIVAVGVFAGLRVDEIHRLDVDDVYVSERKGQAQVRGKGGKIRTVPLNAAVRETLRVWAAARREWPRLAPDERALFLARSGGRLAVRTLRYTVDQVGEAAGVDLHPHLLRHTFARQQLAAGADIAEVSELLGHADVRTTSIYTRPTEQEQSDAVERWSVTW